MFSFDNDVNISDDFNVCNTYRQSVILSVPHETGVTMQLTICDRASFATGSKRTYTDDGFLIVPGNVARTGTQDYLASELGLTDRAPNDIVRVFRPDDSVFERLSLDSYNGADVTIEHPPAGVNAQTYRETSVGVVRGAGTRDGDFVAAELMIKSQDAIKAVEQGKVQLSAGYTAIYDKAPADSPYDFIQREIRINHVALVDIARAGPQARLFDNQPEQITMKTVVLDSGRTVELQDSATAALVSDAMERLKKTADDANSAVVAMTSDVDKANAQRDAVIEERDALKVAASDAAIEERLKALDSVKTDARKIAGDTFACDSVNPLDIQRAALKTVRASVDWPDKSDAYVQAAFDQAIESSSDAPVNQLSQFAKDAANPTKTVEDAEPSAYDKHKASMSDAWKEK